MPDCSTWLQRLLLLMLLLLQLLDHLAAGLQLLKVGVSPILVVLWLLRLQVLQRCKCVAFYTYTIYLSPVIVRALVLQDGFRRQSKGFHANV